LSIFLVFGLPTCGGCTTWAAPEEGLKKAAALRALPFAPPAAPMKKFDGGKVLSGHFIMPRCKLLNVIFTRKHRYL